MRVKHNGINAEYYVPHIAHQRLTLVYSGESDSYNKAQLWLDDELKATDTSTTASYMEITEVTSRGSSQTKKCYLTHQIGYHYDISFGSGGSRSGGLSAYRDRIYRQYQREGKSDSSREMVSEGLHIMGLTWARELTLAKQLWFRLNNSEYVQKMLIGVSGQEQGCYVDMNGVGGCYEKTTDSNYLPAFRMGGLVGSALEHGIMEQLQGSENPGMSTVKILQKANADGKRIFLADTNTWDTEEYNIRAECSSWTVLSTLDDSITNDHYTLILSEDGVPEQGIWKGYGYMGFQDDSILMAIGRRTVNNGGFSGKAQSISASKSTISDMQASLNSAAFGNYNIFSPSAKYGDPVDMRSGGFQYGNTDLSLGPVGVRGLSLDRHYNSVNHGQDNVLGYGWNHSYNAYVKKNNDVDAGFGLRGAEDVVPMIVGAIVSSDLVEGTPTLHEWMTAVLVSKWCVDGVIENAMDVHLGNKILRYLKLPEKNWSRPQGVKSDFEVIEAGGYKLMHQHGGYHQFGSDGLLLEVADGTGAKQGYVNSNGRVSQVSDHYGRTLTFTYDQNNHLRKVVDSAGRSVQYDYSSDGDQTSYTDPDSYVWRFGYDSDHRMTNIVDPRGITNVANIYDQKGRVIEQVAADGNLWKFYYNDACTVGENPDGNRKYHYYNDDNFMTGVTDEEGNHTKLTYSDSGKLLERMDPEGHWTRYAYDKSGNRTNVITMLSTNVFEYDAQDRLVLHVDAVGNETRYGYDGDSTRISAVTNAEGDVVQNQYVETGSHKGLLREKQGPRDGQVVTYDYDNYGNVSKVTYADNSFVGKGYDLIGNMVGLTNELGEATNFGYDNRRHLVKAEYPDGTSELSGYDGFGLKTSFKDRLGHQTTYAYTPSEKLSTITFSDGSKIKHSYDKVGNRTNTVDELDHEICFEYDRAQRLTKKTKETGEYTLYGYDGNGNMTWMENALGERTVMRYDEENHLLETEDPLHNSVKTYYDKAGRVTSNVNANGTAVSYVCDGLGRKKEVHLPKDLVETYQYDEAGNMIRYTDAAGQETSYGYDLRNRQVVITNALGHAITNVYDAVGRLASTRDPLGGETFMYYDKVGRMTNMVYPDESQVVFEYDNNGNRTAQIDERGYRIEYDYDLRNRREKTRIQVSDSSWITSGNEYEKNGLLSVSTDGNGNETIYRYDKANRLAKIEYPNGGIQRIVYDLAGRKSTLIECDDSVVTFGYDSLGRTVAVTNQVRNGEDVVFSSEYDALGNIVKSEDAKGEPTLYYYDVFNRLTNIVYADSSEDIFDYDAVGNRISYCNAEEQVTAYGYDLLGRVVAVTNIIADELAVMQTTYDVLGNISSIKDALNRETVFYYDTMNRMTNTVYPGDVYQFSYGYDQAGNRVWEEDALENRMEYQYDGANRTIMTTMNRDDGDDLYVQMNYDANGNLIGMTDEADKITRYAYNPMNLMTNVLFPDNRHEAFLYDCAGHMTSFINGRGKTSEFTYNDLGWLTVNQDALDKDKVMSYDKNGNVEKVVTRAGDEIFYTYDKRNRLIELKHGAELIASFEYNRIGQMTNMEDQIGTTVFEYDDFGRLVRIEDPRENVLRYDYDLVGNRTNIVYPGNKHVAYEYDDLDRLIAVKDWVSSAPIRYTYDDAGRLTNIAYPNGVEMRYVLDERGLITALTCCDDTETILLSRQLERNALGHVVNEEVQGRLGISLDDIVNKNDYDDADQISTITDMLPEPTTEVSVSHDDEGNVTGIEDALTASWDAENRLLSVTVGGVEYSYEYNGLGNRLIRIADGQEWYSILNYGADLHNPLMETNETDGSYYYIYGMGLAAQIDPDGVIHYYHADMQGNVELLTDVNGAVTDQYVYDVFGKLVNRNGTTENPYLFGGAMGVYCEDSAAGLYHMKARYYSAGLKRFISRDPLGLSGGHNLYAYAENNPLSFVDPAGLCAGSLSSSSSGMDFSSSWTDYMLGGVASSLNDTYQALDNTIASVSGGSSWSGGSLAMNIWDYDQTAVLISRSMSTPSGSSVQNSSSYSSSRQNGMSSIDKAMADFGVDVGSGSSPAELASLDVTMVPYESQEAARLAALGSTEKLYADASGALTVSDNDTIVDASSSGTYGGNVWFTYDTNLKQTVGHGEILNDKIGDENEVVRKAATIKNIVNEYLYEFQESHTVSPKLSYKTPMLQEAIAKMEFERVRNESTGGETINLNYVPPKQFLHEPIESRQYAVGGLIYLEYSLYSIPEENREYFKNYILNTAAPQISKSTKCTVITGSEGFKYQPSNPYEQYPHGDLIIYPAPESEEIFKKIYDGL